MTSMKSKDQKNVEMQTQVDPSVYVSPAILSYQNPHKEQSNKILLMPKTVALIIGVVVALNVISYTLIPKQEFEYHGTDPKLPVKLGLGFAFTIFMTFVICFYPDTIIIRPHPVFWRMLLGICTLYLMFMTYLFMLPLTEGRQLFKIFSPELGVQLPERSYADDCAVYTPDHPESMFFNIKDALYDIHFVAHLFGWWFKMLIIRDVGVCWICSILFEVLEISYRHWLPNFYECWWDHFFLDMFGCNFLGIVLGAWSCNYFNVARLKWIAVDETSPAPELSATSFLSKFNPAIWMQYDWKVFKSFKLFCAIIFYCFFILTVDCDNFFLKFIYWVPPEHWLIQVRVAIWGFAAIPATKEFYEYVTNPHCNRVGPFIWILTLTLAVEQSIVYKQGTTIFDEDIPSHVKMMWAIIFSAIACLGIYIYRNEQRQKNLQVKPVFRTVETQFNPQSPKSDTEPLSSANKKRPTQGKFQ